ncbi:hypothetical protein ACWGOK_36075 [Streptomyces eurythermus]
MTSPAPTPAPSPSQVGPCTGCQEPTVRYGPGGSPLCTTCAAALNAWRDSQGKPGSVRA